MTTYEKLSILLSLIQIWLTLIPLLGSVLGLRCSNEIFFG